MLLNASNSLNAINYPHIETHLCVGIYKFETYKAKILRINISAE